MRKYPCPHCSKDLHVLLDTSNSGLCQACLNAWTRVSGRIEPDRGPAAPPFSIEPRMRLAARVTVRGVTYKVVAIVESEVNGAVSGRMIEYELVAATSATLEWMDGAWTWYRDVSPEAGARLVGANQLEIGRGKNFELVATYDVRVIAACGEFIGLPTLNEHSTTLEFLHGAGGEQVYVLNARAAAPVFQWGRTIDEAEIRLATGPLSKAKPATPSNAGWFKQAGAQASKSSGYAGAGWLAAAMVTVGLATCADEGSDCGRDAKTYGWDQKQVQDCERNVSSRSGRSHRGGK